MTITKETKPTTSITDEGKPTSGRGFLLKEDSFYLLLETGAKIIISGTAGEGKPSTGITDESKPTTPITKETKP